MMDEIERRSRKKERSAKEDDVEDDAPLESDVFLKKWAAPVLLGPFLPAIFAAFIVVAGQLVLNTASGTCGYDLACECSLVDSFPLLTRPFCCI